MSDITYFVNGIFQGDNLSVLLFSLLMNPLSVLFYKLEGYACGKHKNYNVTHNFFVDDLKSYVSSTDTDKKQLDLGTTRSSRQNYKETLSPNKKDMELRTIIIQ